MREIKQPVGKGVLPGRGNDPFDVAVVQKLLLSAAVHRAMPALNPGVSNGVFDPATTAAIVAFQRDVMGVAQPDGRIDPNGRTWHRLLQEARNLDPNPDGWPVQTNRFRRLENAGRDAMFSTFVIPNPNDPCHPGGYRDNPGTGPYDQDNIQILGGWEQRNIGNVTIPQLARIANVPVGGSRTRFHNLAIRQLQGLWQAWEDAGLLNRILTFDGAFNARYIRGAAHCPENLSNHSWGTAFDINATWNPKKTTPAIIWEAGCVFELVPLAVRWGFYWGGWFSGSRVDGMHFEVAVVTNQALDV
jgi:hypothetical protein